MRYTPAMKALQREYFNKFFDLCKKHRPELTYKQIWELTEQYYDHDMYTSYTSFRSAKTRHIRNLQQA
jgi:hypothetical protein